MEGIILEEKSLDLSEEEEETRDYISAIDPTSNFNFETQFLTGQEVNINKPTRKVIKYIDSFGKKIIRSNPQDNWAYNTSLKIENAIRTLDADSPFFMEVKQLVYKIISQKVFSGHKIQEVSAVCLYLIYKKYGYHQDLTIIQIIQLLQIKKRNFSQVMKTIRAKYSHLLTREIQDVDSLSIIIESSLEKILRIKEEEEMNKYFGGRGEAVDKEMLGIKKEERESEEHRINGHFIKSSPISDVFKFKGETGQILNRHAQRDNLWGELIPINNNNSVCLRAELPYININNKKNKCKILNICKKLREIIEIEELREGRRLQTFGGGLLAFSFQLKDLEISKEEIAGCLYLSTASIRGMTKQIENTLWRLFGGDYNSPVDLNSIKGRKLREYCRQKLYIQVDIYIGGGGYKVISSDVTNTALREAKARELLGDNIGNKNIGEEETLTDNGVYVCKTEKAVSIVEKREEYEPANEFHCLLNNIFGFSAMHDK